MSGRSRKFKDEKMSKFFENVADVEVVKDVQRRREDGKE